MTDTPEKISSKEFGEWLRDHPDTGPLVKRIDALEAESRLLTEALEVCNCTSLIAHALDDGHIDEAVADNFADALAEMNAALQSVSANRTALEDKE